MTRVRVIATWSTFFGCEGLVTRSGEGWCFVRIDGEASELRFGVEALTERTTTMGDFRVTVNAVGGHGCEREKKDGEIVYGCRRMDCPDCITARFIADMLRSGASVKSAMIEHWPGQPSQVTDEFDTATQPTTSVQKRTRRGSF